MGQPWNGQAVRDHPDHRGPVRALRRPQPTPPGRRGGRATRGLRGNFYRLREQGASGLRPTRTCRWSLPLLPCSRLTSQSATYQTPITVPVGDHEGLRSSALPLVSVRRVPSCQMVSELGTGIELLLPPGIEPHTIMLWGPQDAWVASVPCGERRRPPRSIASRFAQNPTDLLHPYFKAHPPAIQGRRHPRRQPMIPVS